MSTDDSDAATMAKILKKFVCPYRPTSIFECDLARAASKWSNCPYSHINQNFHYDPMNKKHSVKADQLARLGVDLQPSFHHPSSVTLVSKGFKRVEPVVCLEYLEGRCRGATRFRRDWYQFCTGELWHPTVDEMRQLSEASADQPATVDPGQGSLLVALRSKYVPIVTIPPFVCEVEEAFGRDRSSLSSKRSTGSSTTSSRAILHDRTDGATSAKTGQCSIEVSSHEDLSPQPRTNGCCTRAANFFRGRPLLFCFTVVMLLLLFGGLVFLCLRK